MLIDTHAHLTDERVGAEEIISAMPADGLDRIITVGYDLESSRKCVAIAEAHEAVYCAVGVHPSDSQRLNADPVDALIALSKSPKCVAIGEIGLDYFYPDTDRKKQIYWLERQLCAAEETGLPVCFHVRDAYEDMDKVLARGMSKLKGGAVMHCFSGSAETAEKYVEAGFYISFSGSITFKNAKKFYDIIPRVPRDRILVETDSPYLTPHPYRGTLNSPKNVRLVAEKVAEVLGITAEEVIKFTADNARRAFPKLK